MYFLSERRRSQLIKCLGELSMPIDMARRCASYNDDPRQLDKVLSKVVGRLGERCNRLREAVQSGNEQQRRTHDASLQADLMIFSTYAEEVTERKLLTLMMFPKTTRAVAASLVSIRQCNCAILTEIEQRKTLH
jgi:hypothetical protein